MDASIKGLTTPTSHPNGSSLRILIVRTTWNTPIVDSLLNGALESLHACQVSQIDVVQVPGSFELPMGVHMGLDRKESKYDVAIAIGVLIKGDTMHFEVNIWFP